MPLVKISALTYADLCAAMIPGDLTCEELAVHTGLHYVTVLEYTRHLHRAGAAHIARWEHDSRGRPLVKVYKLGPGKDADRGTLTPAQRQQRRRDQLQAARELQVQAGRARWVQAANGRLRFEVLV